MGISFMEEFILAADKVSVEYPGVKALDAVDFEIKAGEICALAGANGAGKSTFVKVLSGICRSYAGEIRCNGQKVLLRSPADAAWLGIHIVYQEVDESILPDFTVAENLLMEDFALERKTLYHRKNIARNAAKILSELHLDLAPERMGKELSLSEKQLLLIAKAVHQECRLLILDEPTAALSRVETKNLFQMIRFLAREGFPFFEVSNLNDSLNKFHNISFHVGAGEVVGLAGLTGAGKTEICKALFGAGKTESGEIRMDGKPITIKNPVQAVRKGIALVPEQRRSEGIFPTMETSFNLGVAVLPAFCRFGFWQKKRMAKHMDAYIREIGVKCSSGKQEIRFLSGGNQQKTVIGRWMAANSKLYILDEPMQGVDIGAKQELFALIRELAGEGCAVIYASSDVSELLAVTNRIYVLNSGMVTGNFMTNDVDEQECPLAPWQAAPGMYLWHVIYGMACQYGCPL